MFLYCSHFLDFEGQNGLRKKKEHSLKFRETQSKRIILEKFDTILKVEKMKLFFQIFENSKLVLNFHKTLNFSKKNNQWTYSIFSVFEYIRDYIFYEGEAIFLKFQKDSQENFFV